MWQVNSSEADKRRDEIATLVGLLEPQIELEFVSDQSTLAQFLSGHTHEECGRVSQVLGVSVSAHELHMPIWKLVDWLKVVQRPQ